MSVSTSLQYNTFTLNESSKHTNPSDLRRLSSPIQSPVLSGLALATGFPYTNSARTAEKHHF
jgi:hypothetical protein